MILLAPQEQQAGSSLNFCLSPCMILVILGPLIKNNPAGRWPLTSSKCYSSSVCVAKILDDLWFSHSSIFCRKEKTQTYKWPLGFYCPLVAQVIIVHTNTRLKVWNVDIVPNLFTRQCQQIWIKAMFLSWLEWNWQHDLKVAVSSSHTQGSVPSQIFISTPKDGTGQGRGGGGGVGIVCVHHDGHRQSGTGRVGTPGLLTQWKLRAGSQGHGVTLSLEVNTQTLVTIDPQCVHQVHQQTIKGVLNEEDVTLV